MCNYFNAYNIFLFIGIVEDLRNRISRGVKFFRALYSKKNNCNNNMSICAPLRCLLFASNWTLAPYGPMLGTTTFMYLKFVE